MHELWQLIPVPSTKLNGFFHIYIMEASFSSNSASSKASSSESITCSVNCVTVSDTDVSVPARKKTKLSTTLTRTSCTESICYLFLFENTENFPKIINIILKWIIFSWRHCNAYVILVTTTHTCIYMYVCTHVNDVILQCICDCSPYYTCTCTRDNDVILQCICDCSPYYTVHVLVIMMWYCNAYAIVVLIILYMYVHVLMIMVWYCIAYVIVVIITHLKCLPFTIRP